MTYLPATACTDMEPAVAAPPSLSACDTPSGLGLGQSSTPAQRRLLVAEDDTSIQAVLSTILRKAGYSVHCANNGEEAWDALALERFDCLVTDHDMPLLTGLDLLRRVRARSMPLVVILISGRMPWTEANLIELLKPGAALEKPFSVSQLLFTIRNAFEDGIREADGSGTINLQFDVTGPRAAGRTRTDVYTT